MNERMRRNLKAVKKAKKIFVHVSGWECDYSVPVGEKAALKLLEESAENEFEVVCVDKKTALFWLRRED